MTALFEYDILILLLGQFFLFFKQYLYLFISTSSISEQGAFIHKPFLAKDFTHIALKFSSNQAGFDSFLTQGVKFLVPGSFTC